MIQRLSKFIPKPIKNLRHLFYAWFGSVKYDKPSDELLVIGITGTSGKSSTTTFLRQILEADGHVVGSLSTVDFCVAGERKLNDKKMTMLGKTATQRYLREMVDAGCDIAIVETTSEGRIQHRHRFINYDVMVLTNLYPEHIESHGSFEKYRQAKIDLFSYLSGRKKLLHNNEVPKVAVVNGDVESVDRFINFPLDGVWKFGSHTHNDLNDKTHDFVLKNLAADEDGLHFSVNNRALRVKMYGEHNAFNIAAAITVSRALGVAWTTIERTVSAMRNIDGRLEFIPEAEEQGFKVIVDYAFEPKAMKGLYDVVGLLNPKRIIHVFGSTGGGRDKERRSSVGTFVGERADICIITDEDPYTDDPQEIIDEVAEAVLSTGKKFGDTLYKERYRKDGIEKALVMAKKGDLVLVTGKGSEQAMVVGSELVPWDDRTCVRNALTARMK